MSLRQVKLKEQYITGEDNLIDEFYIPCLENANTYDRAAGFFNSSIYTCIKSGLEPFIRKGGKIRLITSARLTPEDVELIRSGYEEREWLQEHLQSLYDEFYARRHNYDVANLFWLIKCGRLDIRITMPDLSVIREQAPLGIFHDKIGVFSDRFNDFVVFFGSNNESIGGWFHNLESFEVYESWDAGVSNRAKSRKQYFERLWNGDFKTMKTYEFPDAFRKQLIELSPKDFHYSNTHPKENEVGANGIAEAGATYQIENKWRHQDEAVATFLKNGHGILEMATGTGKTRTSLTIVNKLLEQNKINSVIISVDGTDLLDQWCDEVRKWTKMKLFRFYSSHKELSAFTLAPVNSALVVSREFLADAIKFFGRNPTNLEKSIIVCDEVHGLGSPSSITGLRGKIKTFKYRLGLSATPEREYDEEGNQFLLEEIGEVIFRFQIEDAIRRGILCEFDYVPLEFEMTQEDKNDIKRLIAAHNARRKMGEHASDEELYRNIARVKKVSLAKLPVFRTFLNNHREVLNRSIIFVETKEFGLDVQNILIQYEPNYHTYYGDDNRNNLTRFSTGELNCLITSKRISEGIDISSVSNILLFSADKAKIQTIQRIGRSLRLDPNSPSKRASVLDFISVSDQDSEQDPDKLSTDEQRRIWLTELSSIKRER
ncbi:DEAD/DEAH box helicase family protein [Paenibacillus cymbidii]|uniref:DEAD/DEAH box helicase family protein n=1 Tax=Paenibacillus cymbidii TaxID=1639034 RepID=UPI001080E865|nr:DEAD/DEAH box helicase family protein [Paenibacillus cymbidii]